MARLEQSRSQANPPKANKQKAPKPKQQQTTVYLKQRNPRQRTQISAPVALGQNTRTGPPRYLPTKPGNARISHTELIADVNGTDLFTVTKYDVNPGLNGTFPWLSSIANNYESYKFKRLRFRYTNTNATTQVGSIYLAVEYDPSDLPPSSESQIACYDGVVSGSTWIDRTCSSSKQNLNKRTTYLVRSGPGPSPNELPLFDVGFLNVATLQNNGTPMLGKLWVDYDVELSTPQLGSPAVGNSLSSKFSATNNFTTVPAKTGNAPLTASIAAGVLTLTASQAYQGLMNLTISGTTIGAVPVAVAGTAALGASNQFVNGTFTSAILSGTANFSSQGQTMTFDIDAASVSSYALKIGQYNVTVNG